MQWIINENIEKNLDQYSIDLLMAILLETCPKKNVTWYEISDWIKRTYPEHLIVKLYGKIYKEVCTYTYNFPDKSDYWKERRVILDEHAQLLLRCLSSNVIEEEVLRILIENPELKLSDEFNEIVDI